MKTRIKLFGERNTGTRALADMLRKADYVTLRLTNETGAPDNVEWARMRTAIQDAYDHDWRKLYNDALRDNRNHLEHPLAMWKHAAPAWHDDFVLEHVQVVFLVRNPYSWLVSTAKKPYHMKAPRTADFQRFISRPWLTEQRDNTKIVLSSVADLWNTKLRAYVAFAEQARQHDIYPRFIKFEDFLADPVKEVSAILTGFQTPTSGVALVEQSTKQKGQSLSELQDFYAQESWRDYLTAGNIRTINDQVDWSVARTFGYTQLDASDFPDQLSPAMQKQFAYQMMNLNLSPELAASA